MNRFKVPIIGVATVVAACATVYTTNPGDVGVTRSQRMLVTLEEVNATAARQYADLIQAAAQQGALDRNPDLVGRVQAITQRLVSETRIFRPDGPGWDWQVHIIGSKQVNAWCMPGGKIVVYTGLLDRIHPSDDELAVILGHEIAHALREHTRETMSERFATGLILGVAITALKLDDRKALLADLLTKVLFDLPRSREQEQEADAIGLNLSARAGFDPNGAVTVWQKMSQNSDGSVPTFLSTHPSHASRISDLGQYAQQLMPIYERAQLSLAAQVAAPEQHKVISEKEEVSPRPVPSGPATLSVATRPLARIFINDERVASNPVLNHPVSPGPVRLRFEVTDSIGTWTEELTVTLPPGEHRNLGRIAITPPPARTTGQMAFLTVATRPLALIFINGERASGNPLLNHPVPAGAVRLRFEITDASGTWHQEIELTLAAGERRNLGRIHLARP